MSLASQSGKPIAADPPADARDRASAFRSASAKLTHFQYNGNLLIKNYIKNDRERHQFFQKVKVLIIKLLFCAPI